MLTMTPITANWCQWCSNGTTYINHAGPCPRVKAIEYHRDGVTVKRVEFFEERED